MGVNLKELVQLTELEFADLQGRTIALDSYNILYQFLSSIRDRFTGEPLRDSKGNVTSHLSGLFYRTTNLIEAGIEPIFVFDGKPPDFKRETSEARMKIRREAEAKWKEALKKGDVEGVRRYSQQASRLTPDMVAEAKKLLAAMGVFFVQAPSEGEAQAAFMVKQQQAWAVGSSDFDSLLFGAAKLVRNLTISGRRKIPRKETYITVKPELMELELLLKTLGITQEQLIVLGILIGTDYAPHGAKGIGPKTALKLVKEKKSENIFSDITWESDTPPDTILAFFKHPPVEECEIKKETFSPEHIMKLLVEEHEFSEERIRNVVEKLTTLRENKQTGLHKFF
jgi:flap endonuclease-1